MADSVAFAGPTLSRAPEKERRRLLSGFRVLPPAARGDLLSCLADRPPAIVLLDGCFHGALAVHQQEILYALESGVRVIGAASMGALRAAEMHALGMLGAGRIFEMYRDGTLDGDDEVAVRHLPAELGYEPVTVALVEIRWALEGLLRRRKIGPEDSRRIVARMKALSYADRSPATLRKIAGEEAGQQAARRLLDRLAAFSLKASDAKVALAKAREPVAANRSASFRRTSFFHCRLEESLRLPSQLWRGEPPAPRLQEAWNLVQLFHPGAPELVRRLRIRFLAASAARCAGIPAAEPEIESLEKRLTKHLEETFGQPPLPAPEIRAEAEEQALFELACRHFGGPEGACFELVDRFKLPFNGAASDRLASSQSQFALEPSWQLARAFAFLPALLPASLAASRASQVQRLFASRFEGLSIARCDLVKLAGALWACPASQIETQAALRGLLESNGFNRGLWEALGWIAPAELLPEPVNDYPASKALLLEAEMDHPLGFF